MTNFVAVTNLQIIMLDGRNKAFLLLTVIPGDNEILMGASMMKFPHEFELNFHSDQSLPSSNK